MEKERRRERETERERETGREGTREIESQREENLIMREIHRKRESLKGEVGCVLIRVRGETRVFECVNCQMRGVVV